MSDLGTRPRALEIHESGKGMRKREREMKQMVRWLEFQPERNSTVGETTEAEESMQPGQKIPERILAGSIAGTKTSTTMEDNAEVNTE
jgi:hypothetical protein